jgi:hypothetical protein
VYAYLHFLSIFMMHDAYSGQNFTFTDRQMVCHKGLLTYLHIVPVFVMSPIFLCEHLLLVI